MLNKYMAFVQRWLLAFGDNLPEGKSLVVYTSPRNRAAVPAEILVDGRPPVPRIKVTPLSYDLPLDRGLNEAGRGLHRLAYTPDKHLMTTAPAPRVLSISYQVDIFTDTQHTMDLLLEGSYLQGKSGILQQFGSVGEHLTSIYVDEVLGQVPIRLILQGPFQDGSDLETGTEPPTIRSTGTLEVDGYLFRPYELKPVIHTVVVRTGVADSVGEAADTLLQQDMAEELENVEEVIYGSE